MAAQLLQEFHDSAYKEYAMRDGVFPSYEARRDQFNLRQATFQDCAAFLKKNGGLLAGADNSVSVPVTYGTSTRSTRHERPTHGTASSIGSTTSPWLRTRRRCGT
jgi:hypothetical protein